LVGEIRQWFDGPLLLSGAISTGRGILAARAMGADLAYIGSPFIATEEANAVADYKQMIVEGGADDIVTSSIFTGVSGNYLKPSIARTGLDPDNLPQTSTDMSFADGDSAKPKAWKEVWGSGQGIGAVRAVLPARALVDRLAGEYATAKAELAADLAAE